LGERVLRKHVEEMKSFQRVERGVDGVEHQEGGRRTEEGIMTSRIEL